MPPRHADSEAAEAVKPEADPDAGDAEPAEPDQAEGDAAEADPDAGDAEPAEPDQAEGDAAEADPDAGDAEPAEPDQAEGDAAEAEMEPSASGTSSEAASSTPASRPRPGERRNRMPPWCARPSISASSAAPAWRCGRGRSVQGEERQRRPRKNRWARDVAQPG
jgi:hypothetical protein